MSTSWGLGLVLGPALGGYLSQVPMETKVAKTIHRSFLEGCKIVKLNFFLGGLFCSLPWNIQIFLWKDPSLHGKMWQGFKDFRCILVSWFIFYYFNGIIFTCWSSHVEENDGCCLGWVCEWQVSLPLAIIVQHCTCHCTSLHRFSTPCMCSSKLPWIFAYIML